MMNTRLCVSRLLDVAKLPGVSLSRLLTTAETSIALRPFYFAVHPDLFGKHPKEREVNEESLKHLTQHLENLRAKSHVNPVKLVFYIRHGQNTPRTKLNRVELNLKSASVRETVSSILLACSLPLEYIDSVKTRPIKSRAFPNASFPRPVKWDPTFYSFYGIPNPDAEGKPKSVVTLGGWLERHMPRAQGLQQQMRPIRQEVDRLQVELAELTGLERVEWASTWGQTQFRAALGGLLRLCRQHPELDLRGKTVTFGSTTGICCHGNILLRSDDVAESWLWLLQSIDKHRHLLHKIPTLELYLSSLLGNIHVLRRDKRPPLAEVYCQELRRFGRAVRGYMQEQPNCLVQDVDGLQMIVECMTGPTLVGTAGQIHIPSLSPGFLTISCLNKNAQTARYKQQTFYRRDSWSNSYTSLSRTYDKKTALIKSCYEKLGIRSLRWGDNITPDQLIVCCENLLNDADSLPMSLEGCRLQINVFFSVQSDGEMCIPWNYAGSEASRS